MLDGRFLVLGTEYKVYLALLEGRSASIFYLYLLY